MKEGTIRAVERRTTEGWSLRRDRTKNGKIAMLKGYAVDRPGDRLAKFDPFDPPSVATG